jgi:hypothetical protein
VITSKPSAISTELDPETLALITGGGRGLSSRQKRYRANNPEYRKDEKIRDKTRDRTDHNTQRREKNLFKPFVGWDTEGTNVDATPFLFGSSDGDRIAKPQITSREMFDLLLTAEKRNPDAIHVIYGGEYDFNMMLRDFELKHLMALRWTNRTRWNDYRIFHIPHKWLEIEKDGVVVRVYDVIAFFGCAYLKALTENGIGTPEDLARIAEGKAGRKDFTFADLAFVEPYWLTELKYLPILMDKLRDAFHRADLFIKSWHGPGALARYALRTRGIKDCMAKTPDEVHIAARYAFCGGHFEMFQAGLFDGVVHNADINSAYPYAMTMLPNLATGSWEHVANVDRASIDPKKFAVYFIKYNGREMLLRPQPLWRRLHDDTVIWPNKTGGNWYWSPEAAMVKDDEYAEFIEAWVFHDDGTKPFAFVQELYDIRLKMQQAGDPIQIALKLCINSMYGQLAQRAGWKRTKKGPVIPPFHQLEWAGFITSYCRAMLFKAAISAWENDSLLAVDTDGIFTTKPINLPSLENGTGNALGQWKTSTMDGILLWQQGFYWTKCEPCEEFPDGWKAKKTRGAPRGRVPFKLAIATLPEVDERKSKPVINYSLTVLFGYRLCMARRKMVDWRYFREVPRKLAFGGSPWSKREHFHTHCRRCCVRYTDYVETPGNLLHDLRPTTREPIMRNNPRRSKMHHIPWEANDHTRIPLEDDYEIITEEVEL